MILKWESTFKRCAEITAARWDKAPDTLPGGLRGLRLWTLSEQEKMDPHYNGIWEDISSQWSSFPEEMIPFSTSRSRLRWADKLADTVERLVKEDTLFGLADVITLRTFVSFRSKLKDFLVTLRGYNSSLNVARIGQALQHYIIYSLFREQNGLPPESGGSIAAYSLIRVLTDNYMEQEGNSPAERERFLNFTSDVFHGRPVVCADNYEKLILELTRTLENDYPRTELSDREGTDLYAGLFLLLREAYAGLLPQGGGTEPVTAVSYQELVRLTMSKGGLSALTARFLSGARITPCDEDFCFGLGFLLQMIDDLNDYPDDKAKGHSTLFTAAPTGEALMKTVNRMLHYAQDLFTLRPSSPFDRFLERSLYLAILINASRLGGQLFPENYCLELCRYLPVSYECLLWMAIQGFAGHLAADSETALNQRKLEALLEAL